MGSEPKDNKQVIRHRLIGEILIERGFVTQAQLDEALDVQRRNPAPLGKILMNAGYITEKNFLKALGVQAHMPTVDLSGMSVPSSVLEKIPGSIARLYNVLPLEYENKTLTVATSDPLNFSILDDLRFIAGAHIKGKVGSETAISRAVQEYYPADSETVDQMFSHFSRQTTSLVEEGDLQLEMDSLEAIYAELPIIKLINLILLQAIQRRASDIHFEPFSDEFKIRFRLDGVLYDVMSPPKSLHVALTSRIKVLANLNIAETRLPQDGRSLVRVKERSVDLRISTLPTIFGESVVIRILDKAAVQLSLDEMGFPEECKRMFRELIRKPHGILLSTGPTGCGKTTTQYAALNEINRIDLKIITVEDPVEFDLPGLIQVAVRPKINLTFPVALRSILRQDPDVIMVGEIRDTETVQMAIHASLTGHLVFSTLHTNDAPAAVARLVDMGVEPFLIASSMEAILAQRLIRRICIHCRTEYAVSEQEIAASGIAPELVADKTLFRGAGCPHCDFSGYSGRVGIFELLVFDEEIRSLVLDRAQVAMLRRQAANAGMRTLQQDGLDKVLSGLTTLQELAGVVRGYL